MPYIIFHIQNAFVHNGIERRVHIVKVFDILISGIPTERVQNDDEEDQRNDGGETCPEHGIAFLFIKGSHLHVIGLLIVGILLLQLFKLRPHLFHFQGIAAHRRSRIKIEGKRYELQRERKHRNAEHYGRKPVDKRGYPAVQTGNRRFFKAVIGNGCQNTCQIHC